MDFKKKRLKNGMVVLFEKRNLPLVSVSITNRFGGSYEESKIKGIAHFIEHLVFTGTKTRTHEDISREIEKKGGVLNAFTANEITSFWFKLPSEHLFAGLDILADMLNNPKFDEKKFDKEKKVILEEMKMCRDDPQRYVYDKIEEALFEKPFGEGVIGREETINEMSRDFVFDLFKKAYNPKNYIVSVVGNADFDKVCSYLENKFSKGSNETKQIPIKKKNNEIIVEREGIDQANFILATHAPLITDKEYFTLEVLDSYLADGMSSKLFLKIREEKGLAYTVRGSISAEKNYSYYLVYVGTTKQAVPEVKKMILEGFSNIKDMNEKELAESKERVIGLRRLAQEDSSRVMQELVSFELAGNAEDYYKHDDRIREVKLEDVKKLASSLIKKYSTAVILPK